MVCGGIARFDTGCGVKSLTRVVLPFLRWWVEKLGESQASQRRREPGGGRGRTRELDG